MDDSVRLLAIARESLVRDEAGRESATSALLEQFKEACRKAGLHLTNDAGVDHVSLYHPSRFRVPIGPYSEQVGVALQKVQYDPIKREFFSSDPEGPDPLKILASHISAVLLEGTKKQLQKDKATAAAAAR